MTSVCEMYLHHYYCYLFESTFITWQTILNNYLIRSSFELDMTKDPFLCFTQVSLIS